MAYPLEHVYDEAADYANFLIEMIGAAPSVQQVGKMCNDLAGLYRTLGLCELLIEADPDTFFHHLIDSALTRKYFLQRCRREDNLSDPECRISINGPFFDAVAAAQYRLAADLAALSPKDWFEGYEYREDFAYMRVLHGLVAPDGQEDVQHLLDGYEAALQGDPEPRLDVCRALLNRDGKAFDEAFLELLDQFQDAVQVAQERAYRFDDQERVFMEGLALLRLAERAGVPTADVYRFCPSLARIRDYASYRPTSFPNLSL